MRVLQSQCLQFNDHDVVFRMQHVNEKIKKSLLAVQCSPFAPSPLQGRCKRSLFAILPAMHVTDLHEVQGTYSSLSVGSK